jgi:hypothetical protein
VLVRCDAPRTHDRSTEDAVRDLRRPVQRTVGLAHDCVGASSRSLFCATCKRLLQPGSLDGVAFAYSDGRAAFHGTRTNEQGRAEARADGAAPVVPATSAA